MNEIGVHGSGRGARLGRRGPRTFDLSSGGIDISYSGGYLEDIRPQLEAAREAIVAGRIVVPCFPVERETTARNLSYPDDFCSGDRGTS